MITYYDKGQILKGSDVEIVFRLAPQCSTVDFSQVENLTVDFFTQAGGESIEKTAEALSITGSTALVHFQWEEFEDIPDGVLRYVVTYEIEGERTVYETSSSFYLKTPSAYTAQTFVTEENVEEVVEEALSKGVYVLNLMTNEERLALREELLQYDDDNNGAPSSGFPVEKYNFYVYFNERRDTGGGFIPLRLSECATDYSIKFEGIQNGYAGRNFKNITYELNSDGSGTIRNYYCSVYTLNGQRGALNLKTINNESILGTGNIEIGGNSNIYYVDADSIENYSGVVDEIYTRLTSGETVYVSVSYDGTQYPVERALIYTFETPEIVRHGFKVVQTGYVLPGGTLSPSITANIEVQLYKWTGGGSEGYSSGRYQIGGISPGTGLTLDEHGYLSVSGGTGGGVTSGEVQTMIESALTDYATSAETAEAISTAKQELNSELGKYYTSGQTESAITSALTDYATSAETAQAISTATQGMVTSTEINKIWTGTQAEYDQISPKLNTTLYFIKES